MGRGAPVLDAGKRKQGTGRKKARRGVSRPGTSREFQFSVYTDFAVRVKRNNADRCAKLRGVEGAANARLSRPLRGRTFVAAGHGTRKFPEVGRASVPWSPVR